MEKSRHTESAGSKKNQKRVMQMQLRGMSDVPISGTFLTCLYLFRSAGRRSPVHGYMRIFSIKIMKSVAISIKGKYSLFV